MFSNDFQFYPTPAHVIEMMCAGYDLHGKHVLEPSAGKGDIADHCAGSGAFLTVCELHPELAKIAATKGKFLKHDFMQVTADEVSHIDYIFMNPPFLHADKHIMHAWEIAPDGCEIVALCNYSTLDNKYSRMRSRLSSVIDMYGFSDNLGDVFSEAERKTDVEIGLVKLFKPSSVQDFDAFFDSEQDEEEDQYSGIIQYNAVRDVVNRYVQACKLFEAVADNAVAMNNIVGIFGADKVTFTLKNDEKEQSIEHFKIELRKKAWAWIFSQMKMEKYMTNSLKQQINRFVEKQQNVPFTMRNIYKMFDMVVQTNGNRMNAVLVEVFERLTDHYHENRYNVEGWKTNSHYMVNKKFILPAVGEADWGGGCMAHVRYDARGTVLINDLVKALCYITGTPYDSMKGDLYQFINYEQETYVDEFGQTKVRMERDYSSRPVYVRKDWGKWYDWQFFRIKLFKKGTLHAEFKDKDVWAMFNRAVAEAKGWQLPEKI
jgi:hypothetical protein